MNKKDKDETLVPFHHINKEKERRKKQDFWVIIFIVSLIFTIVMFIILINQKDAQIGAFVFGGLLILGVVSIIVSGINMSKYTDENKIVKTKRTSNGFSVTCPYCKSTNIKKITNTSKAVHTVLFGVFSISRNSKQWHCNSCGSDF